MSALVEGGVGRVFKIKDKLRMRERKKERNDPLPHPSSLLFAVDAETMVLCR